MRKTQTMSTLLTGKMIFPLWIGVLLGLFALFGPPLTLATGSLLAFLAVAPLTILFILARAPRPTLSEVIAEEIRPPNRSQDW